MLVSCESDLVGCRSVSFGQLNTNVVRLSNLVDLDTLLADDVRMVFRVDGHGYTEVTQLLLSGVHIHVKQMLVHICT